MRERVETVRRVDGLRVHRFQVVRERGHRDGSEGSEDEEWIVVGFDEDAVHLADAGFDWTHSVPIEAFRSGGFEPRTAGGVPVWGY